MKVAYPMKRSALFLIPVVALSLLAGPAEAKSKAHCKRFAQDYADRRANGGDILAGTALGAATGALLGLAIDGGKGAGRGAIIGGIGGTVVGGISTEERWQRAYRRAYRECRAS
jgi:uncharacterized protein YcfJ